MAFLKDLFKKKTRPAKPAPMKEQAVEVVETTVNQPSVAAPANASVLRSFYISEKSTRGQAYNQYTFVVAPTATKTDVKHAVQRAYKVAVTGVHIVRLPSKKRTVGRWQGTRSGIKKAIVVLAKGQTIAQAQP